MKSQQIKKRLFSTVLMIVGMYNLAIGQHQAKLTGTVCDSKTGETLIGVGVKILGTKLVTSTDVNGKYAFKGMAQGVYSLTFSYIGYETKQVDSVRLKATLNNTLAVSLVESNAMTLSQVEIKGTFKAGSNLALLSEQKNSPRIASGISADAIRKSPDKNTSEVLKRVSGLSVQQNKYVLVRGLADRYNSAMLNGASLPSTEPDRKEFSFDIIPSNLIDKIVIHKTASPDLPGDFAGGIVQVVTTDVPNENFLNVSTSYGYNSQSTFKDFLSTGLSSSNYFGLVNPSQQLPAEIPSSFQAYNPLSMNQKAYYSKQFSNLYGEKLYQALPSQSYQLSYGSRLELNNRKSIGAIVALSYRNGQTQNRIERRDFQNNFQNMYYRYDDKQYLFNTSMGAMANVSYSSRFSKISLKNMFNSVFDENYTDRTGHNSNIDSRLNFNNNELTKKKIYSSQLEGEHQLNDRKQTITWNLAYAHINRNQPDMRSVFYREVIENGQSLFLLVDRNSRRFFSDLNEGNTAAQLNYSASQRLLGIDNKIKLGLSGGYKSRDFDARIFNYQFSSTGDPTKDLQILSLPKNQIFDVSNINSTGGFILNDFTSNTDSYQAAVWTAASYLMFDSKLNERNRIVWGARVEKYTQQIDFLDLSGEFQQFQQHFVDWLPSINYTHRFSEIANFRIAGSRTVSRPELRELAPFAFYDFVAQTSTLGNPELKRGLVSNLDLRYEIYPRAGENLTFSFFYKDFNHAIERSLDEGGTPERRQINYINAQSANSYGIELELSKRLDQIGGQFLGRFTVGANLSLIKSKVSLSADYPYSRPLQGQSPYLVNVSVNYNDEKRGFSASTLFNRIGQRIAYAGNLQMPNIWEGARSVLDFQLAKKVLKKRAEIKLNISDLFSQPSLYYMNLDGKSSYQPAVDRTYTSTQLGTTISLGFSYRFKLTN